MKTTAILVTLCTLVIQNLFAQLSLPEPSLGAVLKQKGGFTNVVINY